MSVAKLRERFEALSKRYPATLEQLVTEPDYFALTTATPLQRAICRASTGRPLGELAAHPDVLQAFGDVSLLPRTAPKRLVLLGATRGAKSLISAAGGIWMSQTCDVSGLSAGEIPRVSIVSLRLDLADVIRMHLIGNLLARPKLKALLLEDPTQEGVLLRHPSGRAIEIKIVAGARAGATLVARWSAGVIFDEAPRMIGASDGVVNLDDALHAIHSRMLGPIWEVGSPWAPFGPVYNTVMSHEGKPSADVVVCRAPGPAMNPVWWTPERVEALKVSDPLSYRTDCMVQFADPEETLLPFETLTKIATGTGEARRPSHEYVAAMDPATRGNAWTLAISTRRAGRRILVKARQWIGSPSSPLDPDAVLKEIATECGAYGISAAETDQWSSDALRALARRYGLTLVEWPMTHEQTVEAYLDLQRWCARGEVELLNDAAVIEDLKRVQKRVTQGGLAIVLPMTDDGRHCDYAPAVMRSLRRHCQEAVGIKVAPTVSEEAAREQAEIDKRVLERFAPKVPTPSWRKRP